MIQERRKLTKNLTLLDFRREVELGAIISGRFARATRKLKIQDKPICFFEVYPNVKKEHNWTAERTSRSEVGAVISVRGV